MSTETPRVSLDRLVTNVAVDLMASNSATSTQVAQGVLHMLIDYFDVDVSFLRYNDHSIRASVLIAEWPQRPDVPTPDPLGIVYFADADPVFAASEHGKKPLVFRPENQDYQRRIEEGRNIPQTSMAAAPLVAGNVTTGVLGFVKYGDREWFPEELNALEAIGSLFAQVQARVQAEERLRHLAEHDELTGLFNRRALLDHLAVRLAPGSAGPVATLFFDLDHLKTINDYLGHTAGDWFIRVLADRLQQSTKRPSLIARLGGDEFVVVPGEPTSAEEAEELAEHLLGVLRERVAIDGEMLTRTVSIGVALGAPGTDTTTDLLRRADQAVMAAKAEGGNQVAVATAEMEVQSDFRNDIEVHLQNVIDNGALFLRYLPEVDMRSGRVLATEALVRWEHPTRGLLSPASFIAVAESINLAGELGRWVMRTACAEFARWRMAEPGLEIELRVNVSPVQLVAAGFVETVAGILSEFDLPPGSVCVEITESVVVQDLETTTITLAGLRDAGVRVAIDDFGTGYSVFTHLKSLPIDVLKIDRGFVTDLGSSADDLAIVRAIIALADAFGLQLVAEGVETEAAALTLLHHGCHRSQGFLFSQPLSGDDMLALLSAGQVPVHFPAEPGA